MEGIILSCIFRACNDLLICSTCAEMYFTSVFTVATSTLRPTIDIKVQVTKPKMAATTIGIKSFTQIALLIVRFDDIYHLP